MATRTIILLLAAALSASAEPNYSRIADAIDHAYSVSVKSQSDREARWWKVAKAVGKPKHWYKQVQPLASACREQAIRYSGNPNQQVVSSTWSKQAIMNGTRQRRIHDYVGKAHTLSPEDQLKHAPCETLKLVCRELTARSAKE